MLRKELGQDFIIVTPGIRPLEADVGDQKRVATPSLAVKNGSNFLVVGRPIVKAKSPLQAAKDILKEIESIT
jgi:orotidine-5'-phosphate decarboxylase